MLTVIYNRYDTFKIIMKLFNGENSLVLIDSKVVVVVVMFRYGVELRDLEYGSI